MRLKNSRVSFRMAGLCVMVLLAGCQSGKTDQADSAPEAPSIPSSQTQAGLAISCPDFQPGQAIPARYTCDGDNISPALNWSGVPSRAKSLVLVCEDPDAPGGTFLHWAVVNLPAQNGGVAAGGPLPQGAMELFNDFGKIGYGGPRPPSGTHRYFFKLYALDVPTLDGASRENFAALIQKRIVGQAELMGTYQRQK